MREIKFRGKGIFDGEWAYGGISYLIPFSPAIITRKRENTEDVPTAHVVDRETVGQYTGLKDKSEVPREIWEDDVIYDPISNKYFTVEYDGYSGMFLFCENGSKEGMDFYEFEDTSSSWFVYGNIHDNPELLEVENR